MTRKRGVSFDEATYERIDSKTEHGQFSAWVNGASEVVLEMEAECAKRGVHFESPEDGHEFLLDRLEEGLDAWGR